MSINDDGNHNGGQAYVGSHIFNRGDGQMNPLELPDPSIGLSNDEDQKVIIL